MWWDTRHWRRHNENIINACHGYPGTCFSLLRWERCFEWIICDIKEMLCISHLWEMIGYSVSLKVKCSGALITKMRQVFCISHWWDHKLVERTIFVTFLILEKDQSISRLLPWEQRVTTLRAKSDYFESKEWLALNFSHIHGFVTSNTVFIVMTLYSLLMQLDSLRNTIMRITYSMSFMVLYKV